MRLPYDLPVNPTAPPEPAGPARRWRQRRAPFDVAHVHLRVVSPFAVDAARVALGAGLPSALTWHCMLARTGYAVQASARCAVGHAPVRPQRGLRGGRCRCATGRWGRGGSPSCRTASTSSAGGVRLEPDRGPSGTDRHGYAVGAPKRPDPCSASSPGAAPPSTLPQIEVEIYGDGPDRTGSSAVSPRRGCRAGLRCRAGSRARSSPGRYAAAHVYPSHRPAGVLRHRGAGGPDRGAARRRTARLGVGSSSPAGSTASLPPMTTTSSSGWPRWSPTGPARADDGIQPRPSAGAGLGPRRRRDAGGVPASRRPMTEVDPALAGLYIVGWAGGRVVVDEVPRTASTWTTSCRARLAGDRRAGDDRAARCRPRRALRPRTPSGGAAAPRARVVDEGSTRGGQCAAPTTGGGLCLRLVRPGLADVRSCPGGPACPACGPTWGGMDPGETAAEAVHREVWEEEEVELGELVAVATLSWVGRWGGRAPSGNGPGPPRRPAGPRRAVRQGPSEPRVREVGGSTSAARWVTDGAGPAAGGRQLGPDPAGGYRRRAELLGSRSGRGRPGHAEADRDCGRVGRPAQGEVPVPAGRGVEPACGEQAEQAEG